MTGLIALPREVAVQNLTTIPIPRFMELVNSSFHGFNETNQTNPNWTSSLINTIMIFPDAMGYLAYLMICLIPFSMLFISHGNARMASVLGCLVMGVVGVYLGSTYMAIGYLTIAVTIIVMIWATLKGW